MGHESNTINSTQTIRGRARSKGAPAAAGGGAGPAAAYDAFGSRFGNQYRAAADGPTRKLELGNGPAAAAARRPPAAPRPAPAARFQLFIISRWWISLDEYPAPCARDTLPKC
ncbi:hypothetical protein EVAR_65338_1 [Eumeta japonica]|uniref:Uncharacterized protein n=1 Tax=Eumeta variegata TaxID=151549 RepID=A0A4C1YRS6_EUMVA|nr:hypothetical protein EVAR_65338_1 [Eumeta japonica]